VKAAIVAARHETVALSKDGKTLPGPVLPRLQARYNHGKGSDWRAAKGNSGQRGGDTPPHDRSSNGRAYNYRGRGGGHRKPQAGGKENSRRSASSPATPKAAAKPAAEA
jgi:hypothetical protein